MINCTPFAVCTPQKGNAPPEQAVHPLKPFSIKTLYLFHKSTLILIESEYFSFSQKPQ